MHYMGVHILPWEGAVLREEKSSTVKYRDTLRSSVQKTAEPIEIPFGLWARMDPRNHVLDGVQIAHGKG